MFARLRGKTPRLNCFAFRARRFITTHHKISLLTVGAATTGLGLLAFSAASLSSRPIAEAQEEPAPADLENMTKDLAGMPRPDLPTYELSEVQQHKTPNNRIWVTYRQGVYDITDFIGSHPGGEKILLAAGGAIDPFWGLYQSHKTDEVAKIIEGLRIGNYKPPDNVKIADPGDPYSRDPIRHPALLVRNDKPFNAETPPSMLSEYITPNDLFYVRNHLPVPHLDPKEYILTIEDDQGGSKKFTLDDLEKFKSYTITATVQCAGQRRSELKVVRPVHGLDWQVGAISNATWTGPRLSDVLASAGINRGDDDDEMYAAKHVQFEGYDCDFEKCYGSSIPIVKAMDPRGDVILAYKMNGQDLPLDHGYPIRVIVPGIVGARNVKWLKLVKISHEESRSHWQRKDYKGFGPNVVDPKDANFDLAQSIQELPVTSAITEPAPGKLIDDTELEVKGFAWSGGGRDIYRVDVSADGGHTWIQAELQKPEPQQHNRAWAWTPFTATVQIPDEMKGKEIELVSKAVNSGFDVQPDYQHHLWNFRGVLTNSQHRVKVSVAEE